MYGEVCIGDAINWSHPLNRGLVSRWQALPDQQRGNVLRDLCMRNHGAISGATLRGTARVGGSGSLLFDGSDDVVDLGAASNLLFTASSIFAISVWVKPAAIDEDGYIYSRGSTSSAGYGLYWKGGTNDIALSNGTATAAFLSSTVFTDIDWVHVGVTYDGTTAAYYRNGVAAGTATGYSFSAGSSNPLIGNRPGGASAATRFAGDVDDLRIWSDHLPPMAEVYRESLAGSPRTLNWTRRRWYAAEQGGAAFSAWWAARRSQIIGGGTL